MRILIASERFLPSIGGVQTVTRLLGEALARAGHEVTITTREAGAQAGGCRVTVVRRPGAGELLRQCRKAEAIILQGLTLRLGWPLLWGPTKGLAVHHVPPPLPLSEGRLNKWLRARLSTRVKHASVSRGLARELPWPVERILPNPYDDELFMRRDAIGRTRDLVFVGRLIPEKGVAVLLEALVLLRADGYLATATIVGDGPERSHLEKMVKAMGLERQVLFAGEVTGGVLAALLNRHRLMVVPSAYAEPFGVVALEGIACGCVVIGSDAGGLPEAIGDCGVTFETGNAASLAGQIQQALGSREGMARFDACREAHLAGHRPGEVAKKYLEALRVVQAGKLETMGQRLSCEPRLSVDKVVCFAETTGRRDSAGPR